MKNLLILIMLSSFLRAGQDWKLRKSEQGISVYTRDTDASSFKELKATVRVKSSLSAIVAVLSDWDSYPAWIYKCGESRTLKRISPVELIHYQTVVAPWPVDNRDFIVDVTLKQDPSALTVVQTSVCKPDFIPVREDYVRIREFHASWTLIPRAGGFVDIEYQLLVDPGGSVPAWIVNLAVVDGPFETTLRLTQRLTMEKYRNAKIPFITEKQ